MQHIWKIILWLSLSALVGATAHQTNVPLHAHFSPCYTKTSTVQTSVSLLTNYPPTNEEAKPSAKAVRFLRKHQSPILVGVSLLIILGLFFNHHQHYAAISVGPPPAETNAAPKAQPEITPPAETEAQPEVILTVTTVNIPPALSSPEVMQAKDPQNVLEAEMATADGSTTVNIPPALSSPEVMQAKDPQNVLEAETAYKTAAAAVLALPKDITPAAREQARQLVLASNLIFLRFKAHATKINAENSVQQVLLANDADRISSAELVSATKLYDYNLSVAQDTPAFAKAINKKLAQVGAKYVARATAMHDEVRLALQLATNTAREASLACAQADAAVQAAIDDLIAQNLPQLNRIPPELEQSKHDYWWKEPVADKEDPEKTRMKISYQLMLAGDTCKTAAAAILALPKDTTPAAREQARQQLSEVYLTYCDLKVLDAELYVEKLASKVSEIMKSLRYQVDKMMASQLSHDDRILAVNKLLDDVELVFTLLVARDMLANAIALKNEAAGTEPEE